MNQEIYSYNEAGELHTHFPIHIGQLSQHTVQLLWDIFEPWSRSFFMPYEEKRKNGHYENGKYAAIAETSILPYAWEYLNRQLKRLGFTLSEVTLSHKKHQAMLCFQDVVTHNDQTLKISGSSIFILLKLPQKKEALFRTYDQFGELNYTKELSEWDILLFDQNSYHWLNVQCNRNDDSFWYWLSLFLTKIPKNTLSS